MIVLVRVDDRLIHGQVVIGWVNFIKANHIVVIDEEIYKDKTKQAFMKFAVPSKLKTSFFSIKQAVSLFKNDDFLKKDRVILLFSNPYDVVNLIREGVTLKEVNIGGMRFARGKKEILKSVFVSREDIKTLQKLSSYGTVLVGKATPTDHPVDIGKLLHQYLT